MEPGSAVSRAGGDVDNEKHEAMVSTTTVSTLTKHIYFCLEFCKVWNIYGIDFTCIVKFVHHLVLTAIIAEALLCSGRHRKSDEM